MVGCSTWKQSTNVALQYTQIESHQQESYAQATRVATCVCCIDQSRARQLLNLFGRFLYYVGHVGHRRQLTSPCSICITQRTHYSCSWSMINRDFLICKFSLEWTPTPVLWKSLVWLDSTNICWLLSVDSWGVIAHLWQWLKTGKVMFLPHKLPLGSCISCADIA